MRLVLLLLCTCIAAVADHRYSSHGNTIILGLPDGRVEFEWLTAASYRVAFDWGPARAVVPNSAEAVDYRVTEQPASLTFESKYLAVEIATPELSMRVRTRKGELLSSDSGARRGAGKIVLERHLARGERIFGLGQSGSKTFDVRGRRASTPQPFFFTTAGYGMEFTPGAKYLFDIGASAADRMRITEQGSDRFEYRFYYGPTPKEIFETRRAALAGSAPARLAGAANLCESIRQLNIASLSGVLYAAPQVTRPGLKTYLRVYDREREDRGQPVLRPLVVQFATDRNAHALTSVSMLGDELLLAPKCAGPFELPQGIWTDIDTGEVYRGRSRFSAKSELAVLARNGSIVPVDAGAVLELHYYPKLGAEFFIYEPDVAEYTQLHAAPAADYWRLEIESKVRRSYEWVVHNTSRGTLRVRVDAEPGKDHIVNLPL
jgi:alpha-glucosidase (family GH31 glycosyl hydrolase)